MSAAPEAGPRGVVPPAWASALSALRVGWFLLALLAGPLLGDALDGATSSFRLTVAIGLWSLWGVGLACTLVPHPRTLTVLRLLATAAVPFGFWAIVESDPSGWSILGLCWVLMTAATALLPQIAAAFVDGESYGDERRLPLRPPRVVLLGPLPLAWVVAVAGFSMGPLLLADSQWVIGVIATVVGIPAAVLAVRSLHSLTRRFLVFVPAGLVIHDLMALTEPVLIRREDIEVIGPAFADSVARDLTLGASGLALEARFAHPLAVPARSPDEALASTAPPTATTELRAVLVSPSQPGVVLAEATKRRLRVG